MEGNDVPMGRAHPVDLWRQLLRILLFRDLYYNQKQEKLRNVYSLCPTLFDVLAAQLEVQIHSKLHAYGQNPCTDSKNL